MMQLLHISVVILIAIIQVIGSQELDLQKSLASIDIKYWPLEHNDTSTSWISLDGMRIATISSVFRLNVPDLRWLVMDNNVIEFIPSKAFEFLPDLTWISLSNNQIYRFAPDAFSGLNNLRVLDLDSNPIDQHHLKTSISGNSPALERLYLRACHLASFDLPVNMGNLTHLYLSDNYLQFFYAESKSALTHLSINNNQLIYVSLSHFDSLVYLNLSGNWLGSIDHYSTAPFADFAWNYQRQYSDDDEGFSDSVLGLAYTPSLQYLILSSNKISQISPYVFGENKKLIHVDLSGNLLSVVEAGTFNNLFHLENVLLDSNRLTKVNYRAFLNLPKLKIISLKNNHINDVNEDAFSTIGSSADGIQLFLDNNQIHTLKRRAFSGIKGLRHIGLSKNRIQTISSEAFFNLPNLESLVIENQLIDGGSDTYSEISVRQSAEVPVSKKGIIESDAFSNLTNLTSIEIRGNLFTNIEAQAFHALPALTILDLSNNGINYLSAFAFHDLPIVEDLHLEDNGISTIEPDTFPKQLKNLNLANNPLCKEFSCWQVEELYQLENLNVSGIIEVFRINEVVNLPENLTVVVRKV